MNAVKSYAGLIWLGLSLFAAAQQPVVLQHQWEIDPPLGAEWDKQLGEYAATLNLERLNSTVVEYQLAEARKLIDGGALLGESDKKAVRAAILKHLQGGELNREVRLAMLAAWCTMFEAAEARQLWELVKEDVAIRGFFEAVLVEQRCDVAKTTWLSRIAEPNSPPSELLVAIDGLAACGVGEANEALRELLLSHATSLPLQLAASRALGQQMQSGLEDLAKEQLASKRVAKEQLAVNLLANHSSPAAEEMIAEIFQSSFAPAQVSAYRWYATHRLEKAHELATDLIDHPDNSMRLLAINVLGQFDEEASLRTLGELLRDRNITNRRTVRDHLIAKGKMAELRPIVDDILSGHLAGEAFEGIEQALLVIAALGEKDRCPALLSLLDHPRPEVSIRAAWCLRELVDDTGVMAEMLVHCQRWTDLLIHFDPEQPVEDTDIFRLSFLFEAFGRNAYKPAEEMLRWYVKKNGQKMRPTTRTPAIWALGKIWKGNQNSGLEKELASRILDMSINDPEDDTVRYTSAIALGWMQNEESIPPLESAAFEPPDPVGLAVDWALEQIRSK